MNIEEIKKITAIGLKGNKIQEKEPNLKLPLNVAINENIPQNHEDKAHCTSIKFSELFETEKIIRNKRKAIEYNKEVKSKMAKQNKPYSIETENRFNLLTDIDDTEMKYENSNNEQDCCTTNNNPGKSRILKNPSGKQKLPPIIIHGEVKSHKDFITKIKEITCNKFHIKYQANRTAVHTETQEDYQKLIRILDADRAQYHTFTLKEQKTKAFVIKGLPKNLDIEDIKRELEEYEIQVNNCNEMRGTHNPLYMITIYGNMNIKILAHQVRYLSHTKIKWEKYYNKKRITQCHRCQEWGHATTNCHVTPKCLKCAEEHLTRECKKPATTPAKCANCGNDHPANATICEKYIEKLNWITKATGTNKQPTKGNKNVDIMDENIFPRLRRETLPKTETINYWTQPNRIKQKQAATTQEAADTSNQIHSDFNSLVNEFKDLNNLINVKEMLSDIRRLNTKLSKCTSHVEKFEVFYNFTVELQQKHG